MTARFIEDFNLKEAASGAHIYGHFIIQAEAFTGTMSIAWSEYPYDLKISEIALSALA